jgi:hypothetical protein
LGRVYFPNSSAGSIQVFSSAGTLENTLACSGCPGGGFIEPVGVAFDSAGNLYVVDKAAGQVVKLSPSGGSYVYSALLQSGGGPVAVAIDTSTDEAFVGSIVSAKYHVVAYNAAGVAYDDFAAGLATKGLAELATGQLAVNATSHKLYLTNPGGNNVRVFERVGSIPAPTASAVAPSPVGQVTAALRATVNPKAHVLTTCAFEYVDHTDFLATGFSGAESASCPPLVGDSESTSVTASVGGLAPSTAYDYRIKIASFGGSAESGPQSFETLPPLPPEATTGAASALAKTSATLGGSVNPKGGTVSNCHFEYVTEAGFQATGFSGAGSKVCSTTPSGNVSNAVSAKVTGLTAGTAYRFRVVATNNSGTTQAVEKTFASVAETCAENPAVCPPQEAPPAGSSPAPAPVITAPPPASPPAQKPLKCRRGFKKKRVAGKLKCVKLRKHRRAS